MRRSERRKSEPEPKPEQKKGNDKLTSMNLFLLLNLTFNKQKLSIGGAKKVEKNEKVIEKSKEKEQVNVNVHVNGSVKKSSRIQQRETVLQKQEKVKQGKVIEKQQEKKNQEKERQVNARKKEQERTRQEKIKEEEIGQGKRKQRISIEPEKKQNQEIEKEEKVSLGRGKRGKTKQEKEVEPEKQEEIKVEKIVQEKRKQRVSIEPERKQVKEIEKEEQVVKGRGKRAKTKQGKEEEEQEKEKSEEAVLEKGKQKKAKQENEEDKQIKINQEKEKKEREEQEILERKKKEEIKKQEQEKKDREIEKEREKKAEEERKNQEKEKEKEREKEKEKKAEEERKKKQEIENQKEKEKEKKKEKGKEKEISIQEDNGNVSDIDFDKEIEFDLDEEDNIDEGFDMEVDNEENEEDEESEGEESKDQKSKKKGPSLKEKRLAPIDRHQLFNTIKKLIKEQPYSHVKASKMSSYHFSLFPQWLCELEQGFNLLLYGYGDKAEIISQFVQKTLTNGAHLVIDGRNKSLTQKHISAALTQHTSNPNSPRLYIIIHHIDSPNLRTQPFQSLFSSLCSIPNSHIIASMNSFYVGLLWDRFTFSKFNWLFHDVSTYVREVNSLIGKSEVAASKGTGVFQLLTSVPKNAKLAFQIILNYHLKEPNGAGLSYSNYYKACRQELLTANDAGFKSLLQEFKDHKLLLIRKIDGQEHFYSPLDPSTMKIVSDSIK